RACWRLGGGSIRVCEVGSRRVGVDGRGWVWHPGHAVFEPCVASGEWKSRGRRGCVPPQWGIRLVRADARPGGGGVRVRGLFLWVSFCYYTDVRKETVAFLTLDSVKCSTLPLICASQKPPRAKARATLEHNPPAGMTQAPLGT